MNRLFKIVFNKARGQYVVCGEYSKTHTKSSSLKAVVVSAVMGLSMITGGNALATNPPEYSIYDGTKSDITSNVTLAKEDSGDTPNYAYTTGGSSTDKLDLTNINNPTATPKPKQFATTDSIYFYYNNKNSTTPEEVTNALKVTISDGMTVGNLYGAYLDYREYAASVPISVQSILEGGVQVTTNTITANDVIGIQTDSFDVNENIQAISKADVSLIVNGGGSEDSIKYNIIGLSSNGKYGGKSIISNSLENTSTNVTVIDGKAQKVIGIASFVDHGEDENTKSFSKVENYNVNVQVLKSESGSGSTIENDVTGIVAEVYGDDADSMIVNKNDVTVRVADSQVGGITGVYARFDWENNGTVTLENNHDVIVTADNVISFGVYGVEALAWASGNNPIASGNNPINKTTVINGNDITVKVNNSSSQPESYGWLSIVGVRSSAEFCATSEMKNAGKITVEVQEVTGESEVFGIYANGENGANAIVTNSGTNVKISASEVVEALGIKTIASVDDDLERSYYSQGQLTTSKVTNQNGVSIVVSDKDGKQSTIEENVGGIFVNADTSNKRNEANYISKAQAEVSNTRIVNVEVKNSTISSGNMYGIFSDVATYTGNSVDGAQSSSIVNNNGAINVTADKVTINDTSGGVYAVFS